MSRRQRNRGMDDQPFALDESPGHRAARLEHLMYEEIDRLFRLELNDRRLQWMVPVSLQLSGDLRNAKVLYGLRPGPGGAEPPAGREKQVQEGLEAATPFLRSRVAEALSMKRAPDLHFHRDRVAEASLRAARLLAEEQAAQKK